jgi:pimeloyl-ACP methyl ester carboxylesterase
MLLHGFGESSDIFKYQTAFLQQHYTLLLPDIPGTGRSALPTEAMAMELIADFIQEILMQEQVADLILIGHSMGGYAALAFAGRYSTSLKALGLLHSTARTDDEAKKENRRKSVKLIANGGKEVFLNAMIPNLYSEHSKESHAEELQFHLTIARAITSESLIAYTNAMIDREDTTAILRNTKLPVLFVIGKEDNVVPYKEMLSQSTMPLNSMVELFEQVGHTSMLECPEKVNDVLNNFCKYVLQNKIA